MRQRQRRDRSDGPRGRFPWVAGFLLVALAVAAVGAAVAVGASADRGDSPPPVGVAPLDPGQPAAEELAAAVREAGRRADRKRLERQLPAAKAEREASRRAYRGLGRDGAIALAAERFGGSATAPGLYPFAGTDEVDLLNAWTARVVRGRRASVIESSGGPLAAEEDGELVPLDLRLEPRGDGFAPSAAPVPIVFSGRLRGGVRAPGGVTIEHEGADDVAGERVRGSVVYASAHADADVVVRPTVEGVELYDVLRSAQSPEELAISVRAPGGATLRNSDRGIEVVRDGEVLGRFGLPFAADADGVAVDVKMRVDDSTLRMQVAHRGRDLRYPILVDPPYSVSEAFDDNNWTPDNVTWNGRGGWYPEVNGPADRFNTYIAIPGAWRGGGPTLERGRGSNWYNDGEYAYWRYRSVGNTRIVSASLRQSLGAETGSSLCMFRGISGWSKEGAFVWEVNDGPNTICGDGEPGTCCGDEWTELSGSWTVKGRLWNNLLSGLYFRFNGHRNFFVHRTRYAWVELWDDEDPAITADVPSGWTKQPTVTARASDPGTGVREASFNGQLHTTSCTGTRQSLCPAGVSVTRTFPEGISVVDAVVKDGSGRVSKHGRGLKAQYWDDRTFSGYRVDKTDAEIDFTWGERSPDPALHEDELSARWEGRLRPPATGRYTFFLQSDDYSEVWINGVSVATAHCCQERSGTVSLEGGRMYDLRVDYREEVAPAYMRLLWQGPGLTKRIVGRDHLFPPAGTPLAPFEAKVDTSSPSVTPSGELWDRRGEIIDRSMTASVTATDGDPLGTAATRRSGVQRIEAWLTYPPGLRVMQSKVEQGTSCTVRNGQGQNVPSDDSCPMTHSYTFDGGNPVYPPGQYKIEFLTYDHAGNPAGEKSWTFTKGDLTDPILLSLTHSPTLPAGWVDNHSGRVTGSATDVGTGLHRLELTEPLSGGDRARPRRYKSPGTQTDCQGSLELPCPAAGDEHFDYTTGGYREGYVQPSVIAVDASGRRSNRLAYTLKVDHTPPNIALTGPLAPYRNGAVVSAGQHRLDVNVTDGVRGGTQQQQRSGVKSTELQISRNEGPFESQGILPNNDCTGDSCPDTASYTVDTTSFGDGLHAIRVITYDRLDHRSEDTFKFFIDLQPPTIESVTHTPPLPTGWVNAHAQSVSVTARDAGTGIKAYTLTKPTPSGDVQQTADLGCEVSPDPARRCPRSGEATRRSLSYNTAELAEGRVTLRLDARDAVGRESATTEWTLNVDHTPPEISLGGGLYDFRGASLTSDGYSLWVDAYDGDEQTARAGVRWTRISTRKEGEAAWTSVAYAEQQCSEGSCPLELDWDFLRADHAVGTYEIRVTAEDWAGNLTSPQDFTVTLSAERNPAPANDEGANDTTDETDNRSANYIAREGIGGCNIETDLNANHVVRVVDGLRVGGYQTTVYFADQSYEVTHCSLTREFEVLQHVAAIPTPDGIDMLVVADARPSIHYQDGLSIAHYEFKSPTDPDFIAAWPSAKAAALAEVLPPTTFP